MSDSLHSATLEIDLAAIRANYRLLKTRHAKKSVAAVVKANAYGMGVEDVSKALYQEGCRTFFVATIAEGIALRELLPTVRIGVFNGLLAGDEKECLRHELTPVLNNEAQVERWVRAAKAPSPAMLHIDTGMTRLGFGYKELEELLMREHTFVTHHLKFLLSHLACASEPAHPKNAEQLARFKEAAELLPRIKTSLANSAGLFLPHEYHCDLGRPGCALYGINPGEGDNPMQAVAILSAPLLQVRTLEQDETVGYGATYKAKKGSRIAIAALGYADGWPRDLSSRGSAYVAGHKAPIAGRISMDTLALDISHIPISLITHFTRAEFINRQQTVDDIARDCGTIGYEVFTRIGPRVRRVYI